MALWHIPPINYGLEKQVASEMSLLYVEYIGSDFQR